MKNYRVQQIQCASCRFCFIKTEYDDYPEYYCTEDGGPRPKCGSVLMDEFETPYYSLAGSIYSFDAWENWSTIREISPMGICDDYKSME